MATLAGHTRQKHRSWHRRNTSATDSSIKAALRRVTEAVTIRASAFSSTGIRVPGSSVLNLEVAIEAVYLVIGHMNPVHLLVLVVLVESLRFIVTREASFFRNAALERTGYL